MTFKNNWNENFVDEFSIILDNNQEEISRLEDRLKENVHQIRQRNKVKENTKRIRGQKDSVRGLRYMLLNLKKQKGEKIRGKTIFVEIMDNNFQELSIRDFKPQIHEVSPAQIKIQQKTSTPARHYSKTSKI